MLNGRTKKIFKGLSTALSDIAYISPLKNNNELIVVTEKYFLHFRGEIQIINWQTNFKVCEDKKSSKEVLAFSVTLLIQKDSVNESFAMATVDQKIKFYKRDKLKITMFKSLELKHQKHPIHSIFISNINNLLLVNFLEQNRVMLFNYEYLKHIQTF